MSNLRDDGIRSRPRRALRSPAVAAMAAIALLAGGGVAAASGWVEIFRTQEVAPVGVTLTDVASLTRLPDLSAFGRFEVVRDVDVREVQDAAAAEQDTGLEAPEVRDLPRGVVAGPSHAVLGRASAIFTFSPDAPDRLEGSRFRLSAGPGIATVWSAASGLPALVVGRAVAPSVDSSGTSFETARDYLLSRPGFPDDVAAQLHHVTGDGSTLPLLVPSDLADTTTVEIGGVEATLVTSRDRTMSGVVWVEDGVITAVGGSLSADEVVSVARELR